MAKTVSSVSGFNPKQVNLTIKIRPRNSPDQRIVQVKGFKRRRRGEYAIGVDLNSGEKVSISLRTWLLGFSV